jgi:hypothetical protein
MNHFQAAPAGPWWGTLASTIVLVLSPAVAGAQQLRSTREMWSLDPAAVDRAARSDLLSTLAPIQRRLGPGPWIRMDHVWLSARPYGSHFAGLCRSDRLELKYAPVEGRSDPVEQRLRPYGFEASVQFHAVRVPKAYAEDDRNKAHVWSPECDAIDPNAASWFTATDEQEAARAVNWLQAAANAVRSGKIALSSCGEPPLEERRTCRDIVVDPREVSKITSAGGCIAADAEACYTIETEDFVSLRIVGRVADSNALAPAEIKSIKARFAFPRVSP